MARFGGLLLSAVLVLAGCSNSGESAGQESKNELEATSAAPSESQGTEVAEADAKAEAKAPAQIKVRTSPEGRWLVVITDIPEATNFPAILLEISKAGDKYEAKLLEAQHLPGKPALKSAEITDTKLHLVVEASAGHLLDFEATFDKGEMNGNVAFSKYSCNPIRMVPTEVDTIKDLQPKEAGGAPDLEAIGKMPLPEPGPDGTIAVTDPQSDPIHALKAFCKAFPRSGLIIAARGRVLLLAKRMKLDSAAVDEAMNEFVQAAAGWGPRMGQKAKYEAAVMLSDTRYFVEKSLKYFDELEKEMSPETRKDWKELIDEQRANAQTNLALSTILQDADAEKQGKAAEQLESIRKKQPLNHEILFALAKYNESQERDEKAFEYYSRLSVLPFVETILQETWQRDNVKNPLPSESAAKLWKKRKGNTDGLDAYLDKLYRKELASFADKPVPPREDGANRVALLEVFTGPECVPCLGANVALARLENVFAPTELITLLYEQHANGPNPLANEESEARYAYYFSNESSRVWPTACVSGKQVQNVGGVLLPKNDEVVQRIRDAIDPILKDKTDVKIKLQAAADKGAVRISAQAEGLKSSSQSIRMRLAIAEDEVSYIGTNGIRHHRMVVRTLVGGPNGVGPEEGKFTLKKVVSLSDVKQQIADYLAALEQKNEMQFRAKPLEMQKLHVVAFVQDDATKEVLQAASVPISGDLSVSENPAPEKSEKPSAN